MGDDDYIFGNQVVGPRTCELCKAPNVPVDWDGEGWYCEECTIQLWTATYEIREGRYGINANIQGS